MASVTETTNIITGTNGDVHIKRVHVTPEIAQDWLDRPLKRQRRIMEHHVRKLADEMRADRWNPNVVAPIELGRDTGGVINGRHRLSAVVETKRAQWFMVADGVDEDTFDVIDAISARTPANVLESEGLKNTRALETIAKLIHNWLRGNAEFSGTPPRSRILDLARLYDTDLQPLFPVAEKAAKQTVVTITGGKTRNPLPKSLAAFCLFLEGGPDGLIGRMSDWTEEEIYDHPADAVALFRSAITKRAPRDISKRSVMSLFVTAKNLDHTGGEFPSKGLIYKSAAAFPTPAWPATVGWGSDHNGDDDVDE